MKTALIFPGQGSQYVGMGIDFYENYTSSREIFDKLDSTIGRDITKTIFSGKESELAQTQNSQPAIMTTSIAIFAALKSKNIINETSFQAVAGHSLGEYSALVANRCIDFEESVKLLKIRSKAMQESMPLGTGGMIAIIGCKDSEISEVLISASNHGKIYIANDNANGQVVLSGDINAINFIIENAKVLKIRRAIKLPVSAPFHCKLMTHAGNILSKELKNFNFKKFDVPLFSNVTAKKCDEKGIEELLIKQVISKVRWREVVENMIKDGFKRYIEIGPGDVLSNLIKRASKEVEVYSVGKIEDLDKLGNINI